MMLFYVSFGVNGRRMFVQVSKCNNGAGESIVDCMFIRSKGKRRHLRMTSWVRGPLPSPDCLHIHFTFRLSTFQYMYRPSMLGVLGLSITIP